MADVPDQLEKQLHLSAPRSRVWRAITDARQFGYWFGAEFDGEFIAGKRLRARIQKTQVDPEVAKHQEAYVGVPFEVSVEQLEPERLFSFRWHPYAVQPEVDFSSEPTTLVRFELEEKAGGTLLRLTESGYSKVPEARRAEAFEANDGGWTHQMKLIEKYLQQQEE